MLAGKDVRFRHGEDADFDAELGIEKRVETTPSPQPEPDQDPEVVEAEEPTATPVRVFLAQLGGDPLRRDDVHVDARAELEAGQPREARHDVDVPVEVLGATGRRAHPEVQRRRRSERVAQACEALVQQICDVRLRARKARLVHTRHELKLVRHSRGEGCEQHRLVIDRDDPLAPSHLLLEQVTQQATAHRAGVVRGEALTLAGDDRRHEPEPVDLGM